MAGEKPANAREAVIAFHFTELLKKKRFPYLPCPPSPVKKTHFDPDKEKTREIALYSVVLSLVGPLRGLQCHLRGFFPVFFFQG